MRCLVGLAIAGCTAGVPAGPHLPANGPAIRLAPPFGVPGESMEFQLSLRGLAVGRVQVAVGRDGWVSGRHAIIIRSHAYTDGLLSMITSITWDLSTTLDLDRGVPIDERSESWLVFDGDHNHEHHDRTWAADDRDHNVHSTVGILRGWHGEPGQHAAIDFRIDELAIGLDVWEVAHEYLASAKTRAVRYEGKARDKYAFVFWVSDDQSRVPLLLRTESKWGEITVELVHYEAPPD